MKEQAERINSKLAAAVASSAEAETEFLDTKQVNGQPIPTRKAGPRTVFPAPETLSCTRKNMAEFRPPDWKALFAVLVQKVSAWNVRMSGVKDPKDSEEGIRGRE